MLSYRHAFHAGNAADVLKHAVLVFCLEYLLQKEKPLLCVDTHAGAGRYVLCEGFAAQNREWEQGIGKLLALSGGNRNGAEKLPVLLRRYLQWCVYDALEAGAAPSVYSGSPHIMARLLRAGDRLVCFELHPADYAACAQTLADCTTPRGCLESGSLALQTPEFYLAGSKRAENRDFCGLLTAKIHNIKQALKQTEVRREDGLAGLKSLLPPPARRGLILIDPSYEMKEEYARVVETAAQALRRFSTGTYIIWYPLLRDSPAADFSRRLVALHRGNFCRVELYTSARGTAAANSPRRMYGSGLVIYNPPWTLTSALAESLPLMSQAAGGGADGWTVETA
jgi:23S rRNA (adenine2030-N6)-methyltransferase